MKLSRRDPYRPRRHPLSLLVWIPPILLILLLALSWWKGGEQPVSEIEIPVSAENLAG
ncbi:hypothetical protein SLG_17780 [Sphingobium sp. SYK-6]|uniref:hypothetical protein n=1 Tax=Sphingobium sp. (strain NBRC 103272 / SYK-6) TaxID=627192 RepID=UPI000227722F|nr:hypothetical protein [Sphingobium sp. SYK-6]BAK66453.1 hypothetical protein SLG_17780 [Sphingobium sp. SYK-6]